MMKKIYFVGKATLEKGIEDFYQLSKLMKEDQFYWFCFTVPEEFVKRYPTIKFVTGLSGKKLASKTRKMDIFVSCSYFEGFCMPIAEALLQNKPVVSYYLPELKSVYKRNIIFTPKGDVIKLKKSLQSIIRNNYLINPNVARNFILDNFSPKIVAKKFLINVLIKNKYV